MSQDVDPSLDPNDDPLRADFEEARMLLEGGEWRQGLDELVALAHRGSILSLLCVAACMFEGWGYDQDLPGAENWYRVADESGFVEGLFGLGLTHVEMGRFSEAAQELQQAASKGYIPAYNALAYLYSRGEGVPLDRKKAMSLWRQGASLGHLPAKRSLNVALARGFEGLRGRVDALFSLVPLAMELSSSRIANQTRVVEKGE
jgi:hypothetical protein